MSLFPETPVQSDQLDAIRNEVQVPLFATSYAHYPGQMEDVLRPPIPGRDSVFCGVADGDLNSRREVLVRWLPRCECQRC